MLEQRDFGNCDKEFEKIRWQAGPKLGRKCATENMSSWDSANYPESPQYKVKNKDEECRMTVMYKETEMLLILYSG